MGSYVHLYNSKREKKKIHCRDGKIEIICILLPRTTVVHLLYRYDPCTVPAPKIIALKTCDCHVNGCFGKKAHRAPSIATEQQHHHQPHSASTLKKCHHMISSTHDRNWAHQHKDKNFYDGVVSYRHRTIIRRSNLRQTWIIVCKRETSQPFSTYQNGASTLIHR